MRGQKRPLGEKTRALGLVVAGGNAAAVSRETGIPETTLSEWVNEPAFVELRSRTKEAVIEEWWGIAQAAFRRSYELLQKTEDPVKAATTGAIIFDKLALSRGDATSRIESRDLTTSFEDHEIDQLRAYIHRDAAADEHPPEAAVVGAGTNGTTPTDH